MFFNIYGLVVVASRTSKFATFWLSGWVASDSQTDGQTDQPIVTVTVSSTVSYALLKTYRIGLWLCDRYEFMSLIF